MPKRKYTKKQRGGMESSRRSRSRKIVLVVEVGRELEVGLVHLVEVDKYQENLLIKTFFNM